MKIIIDEKVFRQVPTVQSIFVSEDSFVFDNKRMVILPAIINDKGYYNIMHDVTGLTKSRHRLVAMTWLGLPDGWEKLDVNHINTTPGDDHASNLEWATRKENIQHAIDFGNFRATPVFVKDVKGVVTSYSSLKSCSDAIGVSHSDLSNWFALGDFKIWGDYILAKSLDKLELDKSTIPLDMLLKDGLIILTNNETGEFETYNSLTDALLLEALDLTRPLLLKHLSRKGGDDVKVGYTLTIKFLGDIYPINPWINVDNHILTVYVKYLETGIIETYDGLTVAAKALGISRSVITHRLTTLTPVSDLIIVGIDNEFKIPYRTTKEHIGVRNNTPAYVKVGKGNKFTDFYIYDVLTKEMFTYNKMRVVQNELSIDRGSLRVALKKENGFLLSPCYRVSTNKDHVWEETLTFSELIKIGTINFGLKDGTIETFPSVRQLSSYLNENKILSGASFMKHTRHLTETLIKRGYKFYFEVLGTYFDIDGNVINI